jgi:cobaltochelatase CobS
MADSILCRECGAKYKALPVHLKRAHGMTVEEYLAKFPGAPIMTEAARAASGSHGKKAERRNVETAPAAASRDANDELFPVNAEFVEGERLYFGTQSLRILKDDSHPLIPSHDPKYIVEDGDPRLEAIAFAVRSRIALCMVGDTGCGKTSLYKEVAAMCNQPVRHISLAQDVDGSTFIGEDVIDVRDGAPVSSFRPGILVKSMIEGSWLIVDELDAAPAGSIMALQQILNDGYLTIASTGEMIIPHKQFRILASANTVGKGEGSALYASTHVLNEASLDRFIFFRCEYPSAAVETRILTGYGLDEALAAKMVAVASDIRDLFRNEEVSTTFSTRKLIQWAKAAKAFGLHGFKLATKLAVLDRLVDDREVVHGVISRHIPGV